MNSFAYKKGIIIFLLTVIFASWYFISADAKTNEETYQEKLGQLKPDDAEGYYQLGLWCLKNKLDEQAKTQFNKVVELNPNHEGARKNLGYVKYKDKWMTQDEMTAQGLVNYKEKWMTHEEAMKVQGYVKFEDQWITSKEDKFIKELIKKLVPPKGVLDKPGADDENLPWEKARKKETDHFIIKTNLSVDSLNDICYLLEYAYLNYQDLFGCEQLKGLKLLVMVSKNKDEFKKIYYNLVGANPPPGYGAVYIPASNPDNKSKQNYLLCFYDLAKGHELSRSLLHECTHYAMDLVEEKNYCTLGPIWFLEGWTTYYEASKLEGKRFVTNIINQAWLPLIKDAFNKQTYIKLKDFINLSLKEYVCGGSQLGKQNYAQGWSLIYFLLNGQSGKYKSGLQEYIEAWKKGKLVTVSNSDNSELKDKEAHLKLFEECMGVPIDQLEEEWKEYILELK